MDFFVDNILDETHKEWMDNMLKGLTYEEELNMPTRPRQWV